MGTPFLGELKLISWNFAPKGWAFANGQFLPINQNQALFSLFGTSYGGNGQTTFALPNLRGRAPIHMGGSFNTIGQAGGEEAHTLSMSEMPAHTHQVSGNSANADVALAIGNFNAATASFYNPSNSLTTLMPQTVSNVGGSQAHENRQPFLVLNIIVALIGAFPSRN
jgi:microcystin-dependent protein